MNERTYFNASFSNDFENINEDFLKCTVSLVSHEQIANNSKFKKEGIERARYSLNYLPVIGWFKKDESGQDDFSNHGIEYVISNDGIKEVVHTIPFGVIIPNSSRYEMLQKDNGTHEEYLVADCYMWKRYSEAIDVIKKNKCNQSVEIKVKDYEFIDNYISINDFSFTGVCVLSENCQPAFDLAKIRTSSEFNKDDFRAEYSEMTLALNKFLNYSNEGGSEVEDIFEKKATETNEVTESNEVIEEVKAEAETEVETTETVVEDEVMEADEPVEEGTEAFTITESTEYQDLLLKYEELNAKHEALQVEKANLEALNLELNNFKADIELKERNSKTKELFEKFDELKELKEFAELKENEKNYSLEELETKLFCMLGQKTFSLESEKIKKDTVRIPLETNHESTIKDDEYGGLFNKYLKK